VRWLIDRESQRQVGAHTLTALEDDGQPFFDSFVRRVTTKLSVPQVEDLEGASDEENSKDVTAEQAARVKDARVSFDRAAADKDYAAIRELFSALQVKADSMGTSMLWIACEHGFVEGVTC